VRYLKTVSLQNLHRDNSNRASLTFKIFNSQKLKKNYCSKNTLIFKTKMSFEGTRKVSIEAQKFTTFNERIVNK